MESYELNKVLNENENVEIKCAVGHIWFEKMQDHWDMHMFEEAVLIVFDRMVCEAKDNLELYLEGNCVASLDPTVFEVA